MVVLTYVSLQNLPCENVSAPGQPAWVYVVPGLFFIFRLSPYVGLKTESSNSATCIRRLARPTTRSFPSRHIFQLPERGRDGRRLFRVALDAAIAGRHYHILHDLKRQLRWSPQAWVTYVKDGITVTRATAATLANEVPNILERKLLIFKPVDFSRPKVCTH